MYKIFQEKKKHWSEKEKIYLCFAEHNILMEQWTYILLNVFTTIYLQLHDVEELKILKKLEIMSQNIYDVREMSNEVIL